MHSKFRCPHDGETLVKVKPSAGTRVRSGVHWGCPTCKGRWASLSLLRRLIGPTMTTQLWRSSKDAPPSRRPCATCRHLLLATHPTADGPELDVCRRCHMVWFDPDEFRGLNSATPAEPELSNEARRAIRAFEAQSKAKRERYESTTMHHVPEEWWKIVPMVLGFPVEEGGVLSGRPWGVLTLAIGIVGMFLLTLDGSSSRLFQELALVPDHWHRGFGITMLTSFFLHAGILHLAGNLWFLVMYGDNVEEELGTKATLLLIGAATLLGAICHVLWDPNSGVPVVGASGGISGLIVYYGLRFPHVRIHMAIRGIIWFSLRARNGLYLWIVLQIFGTFLQISGTSNVSALAHLGGAAVGVLAYFSWRDGR